MASIASAAGPRGSPLKPVPRIASITALAAIERSGARTPRAAEPSSRSRFASRVAPVLARIGEQSARRPRGRARAAGGRPPARRRRCCPCRRPRRSGPAARAPPSARRAPGRPAPSARRPGSPRVSIAQLSIARCSSAAGQRREPGRETHARHRDRRRVLLGVGQRDRHLDPQLAAPGPRRAPCRAQPRRPVAAERPRRPATPSRRARGPWPPPPWRRTAPRGAGPGGPARRRRRARPR